MSPQQQYVNRPEWDTPRLQKFAEEHYNATHRSDYWGLNGAIQIANMMVDEIKRNHVRYPFYMMMLTTHLLLLSTHFSAGNAAFFLWKKSKWKLHMLARAVFSAMFARTQARAIINLWKKADQTLSTLFEDLTLSQLEVLMSPFWAIATKGARFPWFVEKDKKVARWIGRQAHSRYKYKENSIAYALVAGKLYHLAETRTERDTLRMILFRAVERKEFSPADRARLHILLGEHEKAAKLGQQNGSSDIVLKSGVTH